MNIERIMNRYGRSISAFDSDGKLIEKKKCFIQALRYKNKMYLEGTPTEIGMDDAGYYLFLGPASMQTDRLGDSGYLSDGKKKYHIDRCEKIWYGEDVFYLWAVLKEHTDGSYPAYNHFPERR